jgi:hypothetical protein
MSVVSANLDFLSLMKQSKHVGSVKYSPAFDPSENVPDYIIGPQKFGLKYRSFLKRHHLDENTKTHGTSVPLKCDQYGSRPEGASLFNAPTPAFTVPLKIEKVMSNNPHVLDHHHFMEDYNPEHFVEFDYNNGLRARPRPIVNASPSEPSETSFRPEHFSKRRSHHIDAVNYNLGFYGL